MRMSPRTSESVPRLKLTRYSRPSFGTERAWRPNLRIAGRCNLPARGPRSAWVPRTDLASPLTEMAWKPATDSPTPRDSPLDALDREARRRPGALLPREGRRRRRGLLLRRGRGAGQWLGDAAAELGLDGKVEPDQLDRDADRHATRRPASRSACEPSPGRGPVPGFDLTFSAPKSVSLTWALGGQPVAGRGQGRPPALGRSRPRLHGAPRLLDAARHRAARRSSRATASSPPPTSTAPRAPATPSSIPMS